jgi:hypothetical protein
MVDLNTQVEQRHQEFLEVLASGNNSHYSDTVSVVCPISDGAHRSANSPERFLEGAAGKAYTSNRWC